MNQEKLKNRSPQLLKEMSSVPNRLIFGSLLLVFFFLAAVYFFSSKMKYREYQSVLVTFHKSEATVNCYAFLPQEMQAEALVQIQLEEPEMILEGQVRTSQVMSDGQIKVEFDFENDLSFVGEREQVCHLLSLRGKMKVDEKALIDKMWQEKHTY